MKRIGALHGALVVLFALACAAPTAQAGDSSADEPALRGLIDGPLLFAKRHSYLGIHIYDTYYKWRPGGGLYVLENPWDPPEDHRIRPIIDPTTPGTLGEGVYSDPELSWDGTRLLFCFKGSENGSTAIYEIGIDGTGLRALSDPKQYKGACGRFTSQHDVSPAYLPDGRILFTSTRPNGLVPCNNTGVDIMHIMNADGSGARRLSVNNVNEFDPCVMPDGRILHGRWEYVDKTALTQQSLWTIHPDGTNETALYANNLVRPEALLDARPVPGATHIVAATLARHNAPPRGSVAYVNTRVSKNAPAAIYNFDHPDNPTVDTGESAEPWPINEDVVLFSGRLEGAERNVLLMADHSGRREVVLSDPDICLHAPIVIKPRPKPDAIPENIPDEGPQTGFFYVQNIYRGLDGIAPGEVKKLRLIEETSRVTESPGNQGPFNQTFLLSAALAFSVKNFLGEVPVEDDGSAYFEAPAGRALYLQALDEEGRLVQSMRTFVQAVPGATRSCIGCHERKFDAPANEGIRIAHRRTPVKPKPESWGSGFLDYPTMVQPVLDEHCVRCHGGEDGFAASLDLSGGWTEFFNISYENLVSRRETQMTASLIAGIDCMNGTALWSAQRFGPRAHGSGVAPLAEVLVSGHEGRIPDLTRTERDLLLAWIDTNGLYYGTWDYTEGGPMLPPWTATKNALVAEMKDAGCMECHERGKQVQFESDWFNLEHPEWSRILRAPLDKKAQGLSLCRAEKVDLRRRRIRLLVGGGYAHSVEPLEHYVKQGQQPEYRPTTDEAAPTFASTEDPHYQAMLSIIRNGRRDALGQGRTDMPTAEIIAGQARQFVPPPLPDPLPSFEATVASDGIVELAWERSAGTIGLVSEIHRGTEAGFAPSPDTLLTETRGFVYTDKTVAAGDVHYALVLISDGERSTPIRSSASVPYAVVPTPPQKLEAAPAFKRVALRWDEVSELPLRYNVYRAEDEAGPFQRVTEAPISSLSYDDHNIASEQRYAYTVRAVNRRGDESPALPAVVAVAPGIVHEPVFAAAFSEDADALCYGGAVARGVLEGRAAIKDGVLNFRRNGSVSFDYRPEFAVGGGLSIECDVFISRMTDMPVVVSCGVWEGPGWFIQQLGGQWRWYVGGVSCDGGTPVEDTWMHLVATFDGRRARLYQDGVLVGEAEGEANLEPWSGSLVVGQYAAGAARPYQLDGKVRALKIYGRALEADETTGNRRQAPVARAGRESRRVRAVRN